ncbi:MAG: 5-bromo-4-chloroindolyl phosphate hydrolysis family protein [Lachnospiraceae bacterium]|nr:5-bromo-4-chloroindolyl phosphate hydrolysis family protein [Lachnospiraceae bacterium]
MRKSDKESFGRDFEKAWTEGMENNNWSLLNDVIVKSVDNFLDGVGDRMNEAMGQSNATPLSKRHEDFSGQTQTARAQRQLHAERQRQRERMEAERRAREEARLAKRNASRKNAQTTALSFPFKNVGAGSSTALSVVGGIGLGVTAVAALTSIPALMIGSMSAAGVAVSAAFMAVFSVVLGKGIRRGKMSQLATRYVQVIGDRKYIDIETLALSLNSSPRRVIRQIRKMLADGYFPQGHLDRDAKTFILTDEVFNHYLELDKTEKHQDVIDTTARSEDEPEFPTLSPEDSAELSRMIREGEDYISKFHALNSQIPGIEISAKLDRLEGLLREIFSNIRKHPDQMSRIHELMDYYLPTSQKLVTAYREYDSISEPGKEILSAKKDIENTLDTINAALGKLLNRLFKDSVLDVTTDAQVLKTVLVQKGLTNGMENDPSYRKETGNE